MSTAKIAITIEEKLLQRVDRLVKSKVFPNRSKAFQQAVEDKVARLDRSRLARECAKLDPRYEKSLAEEGLSGEIAEWPKY
jgi:metal-responsive CopG/Arc/MetJ family transcriptional regulator